VNINNSLLAFNFTPNILVASPLFTFAFACHTTVLPAYHEMKVEKRHLMSRSIHVAVTMVFISYLIVGEFGYVTFSINTNENIITNYPQNSVFVNLIRIVMTLTIIWSFPMSSYPLRHTVNMLLVKCRRGYKDPNPKVGTKTNVIIIFILVASALCIAIFFPHIVAIFGLLGSTSLTLLAYMLPSFMYIKLRRTYRSKRYCSKGNVLPFLLGIIGFCFGIASTVVILRDLIASDNSLQ
jgi:sodium-coupled neutral amino acid transporter 11